MPAPKQIPQIPSDDPQALMLYVAERLANIETCVNKLESTVLKVTLALIAVIGAQIGMKFVSSPPWVIVGSYSAFFAATFLLASVVIGKKNGWLENLCRTAFALFVLYQAIIKLTVYEWGQPAPWWFGPGNDYIMAFLCFLFVLHAWRKGIKRD